jgi:hypothetical protein
MTIFLDGNGQRVKLPNGKFKRVSQIVTPGGALPEGKDLLKKLTSIATYLDHPSRHGMCVKCSQALITITFILLVPPALLRGD